MGLLQEFNINELAGASGLILGAVSGILVVIFKSRCYCKFRVGLTDNCNICMCERKPPPDPVVNDSDEEPIVPPKDLKEPNEETKKKAEEEQKAKVSGELEYVREPISP